MKIAIIATRDISDGAARASYRLHRGLQAVGHESFILTREKQSKDENVLPITRSETGITSSAVKLIQKELINKNRTELSNTIFSLPYPGVYLSSLDIINAADVINLHWVTGFQSIETISKILKLNKPIVWTLHDMWPFTGGCHYSAGCKKYMTDCFGCPQLKNNRYQIPFYVLKNKIRNINKNLTIVCLNQWMADCAKKSKAFNNFRIEVIPNSIETDSFKPVAKDLAKKNLKISPETVLLLFGATTTQERRKGFSILLSELKLCLNHDRFNHLVQQGKIRIAVFGKTDGALEQIPIQVIYPGIINDDRRLAELYSAADIFMLPSLEDNLPNTMLESMACGTPVIAFSVGGIPDVVVNEENGLLAKPDNHKEFADKILNLVFDEAKRKELGEKCRIVIEKKYALNVQAQRYLELFTQLLKEKKADSQDYQKELHFLENIPFGQNNYEEIEPYFIAIYKHLTIKRKLRRLLRLPLKLLPKKYFSKPPNPI